MSHFSVMVIGDNPEEQLAPYHEYECTGIENFLQFVDITEDVQRVQEDDPELEVEEAVEYWCGAGFVELKEDPSESADDFCNEGYYILNSEGSIKKVCYKTNPNKKWDYYTLGGRYSDFFKTKNGDYTNQCLLKEIDFAAIKKARREKALIDYRDIGGILREKGYLPWSSVRGSIENIEEAKKKYNEQESVKLLHEKDPFITFRHRLEDHLLTEEEYCEKVCNERLRTYALVKEGKWYSKGSMGWWGVSMDDKPENTWEKEFIKLFENLDENTLISVYDCHI